MTTKRTFDGAQYVRVKETGMKLQVHTYKTYSIGCAIVWAGILLATATRKKQPDARTMRMVCGAWWLGWLSATIARRAYPR